MYLRNDKINDNYKEPQFYKQSSLELYYAPGFLCLKGPALKDPLDFDQYLRWHLILPNKWVCSRCGHSVEVLRRSMVVVVRQELVRINKIARRLDIDVQYVPKRIPLLAETVLHDREKWVSGHFMSSPAVRRDYEEFMREYTKKVNAKKYLKHRDKYDQQGEYKVRGRNKKKALAMQEAMAKGFELIYQQYLAKVGELSEQGE